MNCDDTDLLNIADGASLDQRWPVERTWTILSGGGQGENVSTRELRRFRACGILGAAGLGKTFEMRHLAHLDREDGLDVQIERLAVLGQTSDGLKFQLQALSATASVEGIIYLDALDEVMVPVTTASLIVERWIRDELAANRPRLRISCRSAVWPAGVANALKEIYGEEAFVLAMLQPLSPTDVRRTASTCGIDADRFEETIQSAGVQVLSQQPLTLRMLLRVYQQQGSLPPTRSELFAQGVAELAKEPVERLEGGTGIPFTVGQILEAAERLACFSLLSRCETVDLGDSPPSLSLGRTELGGLPSGNRPLLDDNLLRAVGRSALCDSDGLRQFRFSHRQFAEYLAGRRLANLPLHQSRALLSSGLGWRAGVAGPLRETAAFAALHCRELAAWVAEYDPEVIGLSDVADDSLRRRATLNLLEKCRRHELTDAQIMQGEGIELAGYRYAGAEADLAPVLRERCDGCEDVLECAVALIVNWQLSTMSDDLAELVLDDSAPFEARRSAGYALVRMGTPAARHRLRPLIVDHRDDPELDLKGLALRCNWPDNLTVSELLSAISSRGDTSYGGAYQGFLFELETSGFVAAAHRLEGLRWAKPFMDRDVGFHEQGRIGRRIAIASLGDIDEPGITEALADLLLAAAKTDADSPLTLRRFSTEEETEPAQSPLKENTAARRKLIDALIARAEDDSAAMLAARQTPDLVLLQDFPWLLERATTGELPMPQREKYARLAWILPWRDSAANIDAWLGVRTVEPVASCFPTPTCMALDSAEAAAARKSYAEEKRWNKPRRRKKLHPPPGDRVEQALMLSETKDARFFLNLSRELTLERHSTHYSFSRFLTSTPGWRTANPATQKRITEAAKRFLTTDSDEPERCRSAPFNSILIGHMSAIWLAMEREPSWIEALPAEWWKRWCWYILRELHPRLAGEEEQEGLKLALVQLLHNRATAAVWAALGELAASTAPGSGDVLDSLLRLIRPIEDTGLDARLCSHLVSGRLPQDKAGSIAQFLLSRSGQESMSACVTCLEPEAVSRSEDVAVSAAVALLQMRAAGSWPSVRRFLERRPDLAPRVLGEFAHRDNAAEEAEGAVGLFGLDCEQIGQLVSLYLATFPPETDPPRRRACCVGPDDSARQIRDQLINWLGNQVDVKAVEALRVLEQRFGDKYSWLRRPRAQAERAYDRSRWVPIPPLSVAELLAAESKRLICSRQDAVEGVVEAIEQYAHRLRHESPNDIEDLWNLPRNGNPTPKEEERVSDKLCAAIRDYFERYAVTADREVQVFRRKTPRSSGGEPGSEPDILCRIPRVGVANPADAIAVPVEVKLSHNPEARTGLRDQLVDRYMSQLDTDCGVFVVAWMGRPFARSRHKPMWQSLPDAREYLAKQVNDIFAECDGLCIQAVVIDASLPTVDNAKKSSKKSPRRRKSASAPKVRGQGKKSKRSAKTRQTKKAAKPTKGRRKSH